MTSSSPTDQNGAETATLRERQKEFSTLKKSLSASFAQRSRSVPRNRENILEQKNEELQPSETNKSGHSLHVDIPTSPRAVDVALTALRYLPTPILVLSSLKTVILANKAIGRLLGLDAIRRPCASSDNGREEDATEDLLRGQSLSQLGIDMVQGRQRIWVTWEVRYVRSSSVGET